MNIESFKSKFEELYQNHLKSNIRQWYLNPLSIAITEKKYLHPEEHSPKDMIFRVASIMDDEELALKFAKLMLDGTFFPGGRTLYAAGSKGKFNACCSNCFVAGTLVLTTKGFKPIENVEIGDMVITSQGPQRVNNTMYREYHGDLYKLKSQYFLNGQIICTPNHQFLTPEGWTRADRFFPARRHVTMRIKYLEHKFVNNYPVIDLLAYYENTDKYRVVLCEDNKIIHETLPKNGKNWNPHDSHPVNRYIEMTEEFRYFIGRWIGDGSITRRGEEPSILQIVFNATTEVDAANRCIDIGTRAFGIMPNVRETEQNCIAVRWENQIIGNFFYKEFGAYYGKFLKPNYLGDMAIAIGLLDSDGYIDSHGRVNIYLVNLQLIHWLKFTLAMNGIPSSIRTVNHNTAIKLTVCPALSKKYLHPYLTRTYYDARNSPDPINISTLKADWAPVEDVEVLENQHTYVFNLSVDNVHEYNANGVIVHNCFINPSPRDSLEGIYDSNKEIATIFKAGGGIGINLSSLRPNGAKTNNAARTSTGAVSFVHLYNTTGSIIGFHGRRGATLIALNIDHPDIEEFIDLRKNYDLKAMNISCFINDEFFRAVEHDLPFQLHFEVKETGEVIEKTVNARELFHKICEMNWDYGDPGMLFKGAIDRHNLMASNKKFKIEVCNPCAEYTGPAYNSCNLGSLNLYNYIENKNTFNPSFNYTKFAEDVGDAVDILDHVLDYGYELQPLDANRESIDKWRPIGLGFFGFADALIALKIRYGSPESIEFASNVCKVMLNSAVSKSIKLGKQKGCFKELDIDAFDKTEIFESLDYETKDLWYTNKTMRHAQLLSIAPTGSLALLAGQLSSGIEPVFKCVYERSTHNLEEKSIHFQVADRAVEELLLYDPMAHYGTPSSNYIKRTYPFIVEAADIPPMERVEVQAAMQKYIDNAISSTVNLPESATVQDIEDIYTAAWKKGLKGITVFRDNCKRASILGFSTKKEDKKESQDPEPIKMDTLLPIPRKGKEPLNGRTYRKSTACVNALYVTINRDENDKLFEVFTNKSVHGCSANIATITRLVSLALRSGISVPYIINELKENTCQACQLAIKKNKVVSLSCPIAIAEALEEEYKLHNNTQVVDKPIPDTNTDNKLVISDMECPECKERTLVYEGRCVTCKKCGYSKCD